jgi:O-antigen/teichoic acid export membrane protein
MGFTVSVKADHFWLYALLGLQLVANYFAIEWINEAFESYTFILYKTAAVRLAYIAAIFIFVRKPEDILPYTAVTSLVVFLNNFLGYCYIKRRVPFVKVSFKDLARLVRPLLLLLLLSNANMLFLMLDRLYLSVFVVKPEELIYVTYYTMPMLIMMAIMNVISSLIFVSVPRLSNYLANGNRVDYNRLLNLSAHLFFLIAIPICAGIAALGPEIMYAYGGVNYMAAGSTLVVFGLRFIVNAIDLSLSNQILFVGGREKLLLRYYLIGGGLNVLFNTGLLLTGYLTPLLLISTTLICDLVVVGLQQVTIHRLYGKGISPLDRATLKYIALSLCFVPAAIGFRWLLPVKRALDLDFLGFLLAVIAAYAVFYCGILALTRDQFFLILWHKLRDRIKRSLARL